MVTETGAQPADVVRAYRIARDVTGAVERWEAIEALDGVIDPRVQSELMRGVDWLVETASRWYLVQAPANGCPRRSTISGRRSPSSRR